MMTSRQVIVMQVGVREKSTEGPFTMPTRILTTLFLSNLKGGSNEGD
jgi:hypothetical protein